MRRLLMIFLVFSSLASAFASDAVTGRVLKVLPLFLDLKGHDSVSPSLFDRDAYQAYLRLHTNDISGVRFDVWWKASKAGNPQLKLHAELRGVGEHGLPTQTTLEQTVAPGTFSQWTSLTLNGADYEKFGGLIAWRVTLWSGDQMLGEQKSFLW